MKYLIVISVFAGLVFGLGALGFEEMSMLVGLLVGYLVGIVSE